MAPGYIDLVEIHPVQKDPHPGVKIEVAVAYENVPVTFVEADPMAHPADQNTFDYRLHGLHQLDAISTCMPTFNDQVPYRWQALTPHLRLD